MKLKDERHANLLLKLLESEQEHKPNLKFNIEYSFNHYGNRGFMDLLGTKTDNNNFDSHYFIYEVKPVLDDIGGIIRQIHKYITYLQRDDSGYDYEDGCYYKSTDIIPVSSFLVLEDIPENRDKLKKYMNLLKLSRITVILLFPIDGSPQRILIKKMD